MAVKIDGAFGVAKTQHHIWTTTLTISTIIISDSETAQLVALATFELQSEFVAWFKIRQYTHQIMHMHAMFDFDDGNWLAHGT